MQTIEQTMQATTAGETTMIKKQSIYDMLFSGNEPPLIYLGPDDSGCPAAAIYHAQQLEHPHCAFFKKEMELKGMNILRRTLYTTDDWLHTDYQIMDDGSLVLLKKYIKNENDLKSLYFYLTDISVNINVGCEQPGKGIYIYPTSMMPLEQCLEIWMDRAEYDSMLADSDELLKKCFYHMAQITTSEARIISEAAGEGTVSAIDLGKYILECNDEEYMQWRTGFIKKIKKMTHMPVMIRIDDVRQESCAMLSETGADILAISLKPGGIGAGEVLDSCSTSFTVLIIDNLDDIEPLKNANINGRGAFVSSDKKKLDDLRAVLKA